MITSHAGVFCVYFRTLLTIVFISPTGSFAPEIFTPHHILPLDLLFLPVNPYPLFQAPLDFLLPKFIPHTIIYLPVNPYTHIRHHWIFCPRNSYQKETSGRFCGYMEYWMCIVEYSIWAYQGTKQHLLVGLLFWTVP